MENIGELQKQLNPKGIFKNGMTYNMPTHYPGTVRIISLAKAADGKKFALAAQDELTIIAQEITTSNSTNDKWRMIVWKTDDSNRFLYNIKFGKYLARKNGKLQLIDISELPYINKEGKTVNVFPNICCVWNGMNGNRHIYLSDDKTAQKLNKDINNGYCVKGNGTDMVVDTSKTCNLTWQPGSVTPDDSSSCQSGYNCRYVLSKDFCDQEGFFQPGGLPISIEASPGIGTPITGNIYLTLESDNSVSVGEIPNDIKAEMLCTGTYVTGKDRKTPPICWTTIIQESPENMKYTIPSRTGWSISQLLAWNKEDDGILEYARSMEPLAERIVNKNLQILPEKEYTPYFTYSSSSPDATGCPTQYMSGTLLGPSRFQFMWNWQYVDTYTLFAGDQGSGADVELYNIDAKNMGIGMCDVNVEIPGPCPSGEKCPNGAGSVGSIIEGTSGAGKGGRFTFPPKYMIDAAHKNGVKIYGCGLFFQEIYYGGQYSWFMQALADPKLLAKKMVDVAVAYGFDGWMTNFETGVTDAGYTWGGTQKEGTPGYSGQIYAGKNYFNGKEISSNYWKNMIAGSSMPAFRMHGGDLCEDCTTCGSGPVGCASKDNVQSAPQSASTCLYVSDEENKVGNYSMPCSSVYVQGGGWGDLQSNCEKLSESQKCKWVNVLEYKDANGRPLYHDLGNGTVCRNAYDAAFPMTCENPSSPNQVGSLKFSGGANGQATPWAPKNITKEEYKTQVTNAIALRQKFRVFLQEFKKYKTKLGVDINILMYDTEQLAGPLAGGITLPPAGRGCSPKGQGTCYGNFNLWVDDDGTPLVDQVYDMNSGDFGDVTGALGVVPQGITATYTLSNNNDVIEKFTNIKGKHLPQKSGWPTDTGPNKPGYKNDGNPQNINKQTSDCKGGSSKWAPFTNPQNGYCVPNNYEGAFINNGMRPKNLNLGLGRPYDYYQTIQLEGLTKPSQPVTFADVAQSGNFKKALTSAHNTFNGGSTKPIWQQYIYCGIQGEDTGQGGECKNDREAITFPLSSVLKFDSGGESIQANETILKSFSNKAIGIDYLDRTSSVSWTGGHLLGKSFRDNSTSVNNFKGFGHIVTERVVKTSLPFSTYFSIGTGENYYRQGVKVPFGPWTNWSIQDQSPTWQWRPELCDPVLAQYIRISYDITDAYQKGNSLLFRYTPNPTEWLRTILQYNSGKSSNGKCNVPLSERKDCLAGYGGSNLTKACADKNCCWDNTVDPSQHPWCYMSGSGSTTPSKPLVGDFSSSTYMLYAIDIPQGEYQVSLITKSSGKGFVELGVSNKNFEMSPEWIVNSKGAAPMTWVKNTTQISTDKDMVCIWVRITVETKAGNSLRIGGIEISRQARDLVYINPSVDSFTNAKGEMSAKLSWNTIAGIEYYEVRNSSNKLLGIAHQGVNPRTDYTKLAYNVFNLSEGDKPHLIGIPGGVKTGNIRHPVSLPLTVVCTFFILISTIFAIYSLSKPLSGFLANKFVKGTVLLIGIVSLIVLSIHLGTRITRVNDHKYAIAHWKSDKPHALNACFDDARVKCWRWLLYVWRKNNWDVRFSFYYNTLWLTRDLDWLRAVVKLGHEIGGHGHEHLTAADGSITEKYISDNISYCAKLLRDLVYQNPKQQLSYAYPHGTLPILASKRQTVKSGGSPGDNGICGGSFCHTDYNCTQTCVNNKCSGDNKNCSIDTDCNTPKPGYASCAEECQAAGAPDGCKTCGGQGGCGGIGNARDPTANYLIVPFVKALQENYISARTVTDESSDQFLGITSWPPYQKTINTTNTLPSTGTDISNSIYKQGIMGTGLNPVWSWPYQIDLNHGLEDGIDTEVITANYFRQYDIAMNIPNSMIILAGHDFNPTDPQTDKDVLCDNSPDVTPLSVQQLTCACCENPKCEAILDPAWNGSIPLYDPNTGKFPIIDWDKRPHGDPKVEGGVPTGACDLQWNNQKSATCHQSCDACWVATPGSAIISLFNRIQKDKDKLWFATQRELVAYCYNRENSTLTVKKSSSTRVIYELTTRYAYDGEISLVFPGATNVTVNNKSYKVQKSANGEEYIDVQPITGTLELNVDY
ncbi:MAG: polysaccharide deacetylase family protein [bacterium]|nr:polysaccharide deacetylase family protein [bacterium]